MGRFGITDTFLHTFDLVLDVSVGHKDVRPTVIIIVKEETSEAESHEGGAPYIRARRLVDEEPVAFVVIKREHLVGEIGDDNTGMAGAVVIRCINTHAGAGYAVFTESNSCRDGLLFERSVSLVEIQFVRLRVVGQQDIGPTVAVVVENCYAQALGSRIVEVGFLRSIFEPATAQVVP